MNLPQTQPQNPGQGQLPPELMQLLMSLMTNMPQQQAGGPTSGRPSGTVPGMARQPTEEEQLMNMLLQDLQGLGQMQSPQQGMNAMSGQQGSMFGAMGGRPRGT